MAGNHSGYYLHATSRRNGALGVINLYADEDRLAGGIDARVYGAAALPGKPGAALRTGELRYGWLRGGDGGALDEVMLAKPVPNMRTLMSHGGRAVRDAMDAFLRDSGFRELGEPGPQNPGEIGVDDELLDALLAAAITGTQAATILEAKMNRRRGAPVILPKDVLATRRVLLAGPPNAGKSSLLNSLAGYERAFVHPEAGATRDVVDELVDLGGYAVMLGDLPGFSRHADRLGVMAWEKAAIRLQGADAAFFVVDGSIPWGESAEQAARAVRKALPPGAGVLVVVNKSDLPHAIEGMPWDAHFPGADSVRLCSLPEGGATLVLDGAMRGLLAGGT